MQLSPHFSQSEFIGSQTAARKGIDNTPGRAEIANLTQLCTNVLEPVRVAWGRPMTISSGYRSPRLNVAIGGSKTSQHCNGMAADIEIPGVDNAVLAKWIRDNLKYDQLILEFYDARQGASSGWVHVSWNPAGNRKTDLTARSVNGRTVYSSGLIA